MDQKILVVLATRLKDSKVHKAIMDFFVKL